MPLDRSSHTVLVVDDHEPTRYATARMLQSGGYRTIEAATGAEALARAPQVSAVVLDVHLPDLDGFEVCRRLRAEPDFGGRPIVHVSSVYITSFAQERAGRAGADAYIVSPVEREKLLAELDGLLQRG